MCVHAIWNFAVVSLLWNAHFFHFDPFQVIIPDFLSFLEVLFVKLKYDGLLDIHWYQSEPAPWSGGVEGEITWSVRTSLNEIFQRITWRGFMPSKTINIVFFSSMTIHADHKHYFLINENWKRRKDFRNQNYEIIKNVLTDIHCIVTKYECVLLYLVRYVYVFLFHQFSLFVWSFRSNE